MTFEQSGELNPHLYVPPEPLTLKQCLRIAWVLAPVGLLMAGFVAEFNWMDGRAIGPGLLGVLGMFAALLLFYWAMERSGSKKEANHEKRTLTLEDEYLRMQPPIPEKIRWRKISSFKFEPAGPDGKYTRLVVEYTRVGDRKYQWPMILADAAQREAILSELKRRGQRCVIKGSGPDAPPHRRPALGGLWLMVSGCFLLFNGLPILAVELLPESAHRQDCCSEKTPMNPHLQEWLSKFPTAEAKQHFFIKLGAALTFAGCLAVVPACIESWRMKKSGS